MMGVRVLVAENEPIKAALIRLKRSLAVHGVDWELRRRGFLIAQGGSFFKPTEERRAKKFQKRFKARKATLLAKLAGEQASDLSSSELKRAFWKRTGKP
jgi:ribosomal protein S21